MTQRLLITGASSGIGRALAIAYARDGASLYLLGRDQKRLDATAEACRAAGAAEVEMRVADVRDREAMAQIIEAAHSARPIDILVANAGVATGLSPGQILETPEAVRAMMAINVSGVFNTVEPVIPPMAARGRGQIAIVGSMAGVRSLPYSPSYCAAKASVHMWADCLRGRLAPHGVKVSLVVPGFVETPMAARTRSWQPGAMSDEKAAQIIKRGLARGRPVIAFPRFMYYAMRFFTFVPHSLVDGVMRRFHVEVPETSEREVS
ncbi:SDR family NAD(P)-dependent oxidoreductase [Methylocystis parvus]|uniref:SDR family NAD(P)-dependent oxidoreductase n=1 Tax=Methylocystis parvus TaxID=134 RepID=A0A6B8M551_9HYPH|nr:SDR family NAD(P)-dependent oxidoreductase [Methylocystis parvus]QGM96463.1 SDR family NAD(P)-dependent oxidoreductase [Methylocystis parvus]WBJ99686.1 SDR family NAD(P)-dependent oxidoreductase [Methylocystis parvus OBBP]